MAIIEINDLNKNFGSLLALDGVSMNVEQGAICGLLGPNGAGKTTLLRIINGILTKDSGTVKIFGEDASLETARKLGYMPEERGLYDNMTIENQILYLGQLKGGSAARIRTVMNEYLELFNLKGNEKRKLKELSKGNQQKVQIISTLVHEPQLVILDEPFSGFDPINGQLLQELIGRLHANGTTVILSSHNMHAVEEMCDSIALINRGRVLLQGDINEIKEQNKKDEIILVTSSPLPLSALGEKGLIDWMRLDNGAVKRKGYTYRLKKAPGISNIDLLTEVSAHSDISLFEEALPSLNDIFISKVSVENN
ncbi:MAG: ATP-binding cassette domain-containing protein [Muribaculaceae bacterium]|nr:ATP-binding cassette domain-containing protein [Muribaculaceae bacterium]